MNKSPLLIRADATRQIGTGHLMRCLALAQGWQAMGGQAIFISVCSSNALRSRLVYEGFEVVSVDNSYPHLKDWEVTHRLLKQYSDAWMVLDGYHFDSEYQLRIKETGHHLLVIDDMGHLPHYFADIVLNQNLYASEDLYMNREPYTKLLLGVKYVMLRKEFWQWKGYRRDVPQIARRVLVTMGGSDPDNVTCTVVQSLNQIDDQLEISVIVGAANPHYDKLQKMVENSRHHIRLYRNVTDISKLMAWADVAVSAGGSTCWELIFMRVPILVIVLAENQYRIAEILEDEGLAVNLGAVEDLSTSDLAYELTSLMKHKSRRLRMIQCAERLVKETGVFNVLNSLK